MAAEAADWPPSNRVANYAIEVDADPQMSRLSGTEKVSWANRGSLQDDPLFEVPAAGRFETASTKIECRLIA